MLMELLDTFQHQFAAREQLFRLLEPSFNVNEQSGIWVYPPRNFYTT